MSNKHIMQYDVIDWLELHGWEKKRHIAGARTLYKNTAIYHKHEYGIGVPSEIYEQYFRDLEDALEIICEVEKITMAQLLAELTAAPHTFEPRIGSTNHDLINDAISRYYEPIIPD